MNTQIDTLLDTTPGQRSALGRASTRLRVASWHRLAVTLLLALSAGLYLWGFNFFQVGIYTDDANYVQLARSLVEGQQYGIPLRPDVVAPSHFPFGWPLLLAPIYALTAGNLQSLKLIPLLLTLANTALIALGWASFGFPSRWWGLAVATLFAFAPLVTDHARMLMSEPAFTCAILLTLLLTTRVARRPGLDGVGCVALGGLWMLAVSTRSIGLVAIVASAMYLLYQRKLMAVALTSVACVLAFALVVKFTVLEWSDLSHAVFNPSYAAQATQPVVEEVAGRVEEENVDTTNLLTLILSRGYNNLSSALTGEWRDLLVPLVGGAAFGSWLEKLGLPNLTTLIGLAVSAAVLVGYALNLRRVGLLPVHMFVPLYLLVLLVWPWYADRFMYPVLPFFFLYLLTTSLALLRGGVALLSRGPRGQRLTLALASGLFIVLLSLQVVRSLRIDASTHHAPDLQSGAAWIRDNVEPDAIIIAPNAASRALYFKRAAVELASARPAEVTSLRVPVYVLIAPAINWNTPVDLEYEEPTEQLGAAVAAGAWGAQPVFEDAAALVRVYRLPS